MKYTKLLKLGGFAAISCFVLSAAAFINLLYRQLDPCVHAEGSFFTPTKGLGDCRPLQSIAGVTGKEITIEANGKKINAWFYRNPNSDKIILYNHGSGFNLLYPGNLFAIRYLLTTGQSVLAYDYEGYGRSEGTANTRALIDSSLAAYDYLNKTLKYKKEQISAVGVSIGAAVTAQLIARRPVSKVVLVSGFTCPRAVALDVSPFFYVYPSSSFNKIGFLTEDILKSSHPPLLIIHGEQDNLIRVHEAKENFQSACEPKLLLILPHSDHACPSPADEKQFIKDIGIFLNQL